MKTHTNFRISTENILIVHFLIDQLDKIREHYGSFYLCIGLY